MNEPDRLDAAKAAVERGEWQRALELLVDDPGTAASVDALELRAMASYGVGDFEGAVTAWEELHRAFLGEGDRVNAARAAAMAAMFLLIDTGLMSAVRGWVRRAEALLEGMAEVPPHALVAMVRTYERFMCGDMEAVRVQAPIAIDLGARLGVTPALVIGRVALARLTLLDGEVDDGLRQLDEIAVLLMSGDVDPLTTGMMYCELICAAQGLALHDRAVEWTDVMEHWRHGAAFGGINGRCRVHRAELLRVSGPCDRAEAEALAACEELRPWMRREFGWPLAELGNIRLRKGDLEGAEEVFLAAHSLAWPAQPGLALLRLAQGHHAAAAALIADAISHPDDLPWKERPPSGDLRLAPLLEAQVEIAAATGDLGTARRAADSLRGIADRFATRSLRAAADLAWARAGLLAGDLADARASAVRAVTAWTELGAPFDAAVARTVLAEVRQLEGDDEAARLEWQAARRAFDAFGAAAWCRRCDDRLAGSAPPGAARPAASGVAPPRAANDETVAVFHREGNTRSVGLGGRTVVVVDLKGLRYVEQLLAEPGRERHVLDMTANEGGATAPAAGLPALDARARDAYRRRLADVDDDIDEAIAMNDPVRRELAERDREYLVAELRRAVGLGGRERELAGDAERARTAVTRSIRYALARLAEHHPVAAAHLEQRINTGTYCSYLPDPVAPVDWRL